MVNHALVCLLSCSLLLACADETPATQITVLLDADSALASRIATLDVRVEGGAGDPLEPRYMERIAAPVLPLRVALVPFGGDVSRIVRVEALARSADDALLGVVRIRTAFQARTSIEHALRFEACCEAVAASCGPTQTCRACACTSEDPSTPDAGMPDGGPDVGPPPCVSWPRTELGVSATSALFDVVGDENGFAVAYRGAGGLTVQRLSRMGEPTGAPDVLGDTGFSMDALAATTGMVIAVAADGMVVRREVGAAFERAMVSVDASANSPRLAEGADGEVALVFLVDGPGPASPETQVAIVTADGVVREGPRPIVEGLSNLHLVWTGSVYLLLAQQGTSLVHVRIDQDGNRMSGPNVVPIEAIVVPQGVVRVDDTVFIASGFGTGTELIELELTTAFRGMRRIEWPSGWTTTGAGSELVASASHVLHGRWGRVAGAESEVGEDHIFVDTDRGNPQRAPSRSVASTASTRAVDVAFSDGQFLLVSSDREIGSASALFVSGVCPE